MAFDNLVLCQPLAAEEGDINMVFVDCEVSPGDNEGSGVADEDERIGSEMSKFRQQI